MLTKEMIKMIRKPDRFSKKWQRWADNRIRRALKKKGILCIKFNFHVPNKPGN